MTVPGGHLLLSAPSLDFREMAMEWAASLDDPYLRDQAAEAAELVLRKGFDLPKLIVRDNGYAKKHGINVAQYRPGRLEVNSNSRLWKDIKNKGGLKHLYQSAVESGWSAQENAILHELSHHIDDTLRSNFHDHSIHSRFDDLDSSDIKRLLSEYGATSREEFSAELISSILKGRTFPERMMQAADLDRFALGDKFNKANPLADSIFKMGSGQVANTSAVEQQFGDMMTALYKESGSSLRIEILKNSEVSKFIDDHARVLDNSFEFTKMSDLMRQRLKESDWMFSGMKTFHELNEAFPSLLDEKGERKSFEQFLKDVQKIDSTYNRNYLNAEYNFAQASAGMAAKWEDFLDDGDDYYLQYRTAGDSNVRPEHAELNGITLPASDKFWDTYFPPNGWNCRCTVVQVRKDKYTPTPHDQAMSRGSRAMANEKTAKMFAFNSGKQQKVFPDYNPYTISKCATCDRAKLNLAAGIPDNQVCQACRTLKMIGEPERRIKEYQTDKWEHTYVSKKSDGFVVTEHERIAESKINNIEAAKFDKELSMCIDIADNGVDVEFLHGVGRPVGKTYDIHLNKRPADLKYIDPEGNGAAIPKHTKHAFRDQGAEIVVFRLPSHNYHKIINEAYRKYGSEGSIYYYFADDIRIRKLPKNEAAEKRPRGELNPKAKPTMQIYK